MKYEAIVLAAGNASRSSLNYNKVFYEIDGTPMILLSTRNFINDFDCVKIHIVCKENDMKLLQMLYKGVFKVDLTIGGNSRQESVKNGLNLVKEDYVLIHDGARPNYSLAMLDRLKDALNKYDSVIPIIDVKDTIKEVNGNVVKKTFNRNSLKIVQTPQAFKTNSIIKAHDLAKRNDYPDDSSMIEDLLDEPVYVVDGEISNYKYTYKEDFKDEKIS